jgi:hypothetical protein
MGLMLLGGDLAIIGLIIAVMGRVQQGGKRRKGAFVIIHHYEVKFRACSQPEIFRDSVILAGTTYITRRNFFEGWILPDTWRGDIDNVNYSKKYHKSY